MSETERDDATQGSSVSAAPIQMSIPCRSAAFQGKSLDVMIRDETMSFSIDGQTLLEGPVLACFNQHMEFPSFSDSVKYLSVNTGEHVIQLNASKAQLNDLRHIRDGFSAINDPRFASRTRAKAVLYIVVGLAMIIAGPALTTLSYLFPNSGGRFRIFFGLCIVGLGVLVKGFVLMGQAKRARAYAK